MREAGERRGRDFVGDSPGPRGGRGESEGGEGVLAHEDGDEEAHLEEAEGLGEEGAGGGRGIVVALDGDGGVALADDLGVFLEYALVPSRVAGREGPVALWLEKGSWME